MTITDLLTTIKTKNPQIDLTMIELAYEFAEKAHSGQKRSSGEDYIQHCLATANTLAELNLPISIIIAGLLHDVPEDTAVTLEEIKKNFGTDVAKMVEGITKLSYIKYRGIDRYLENLRKMFVAMAEDIRVILIKFADRLHNLRTLYSLPADKQKRIALESLEIYAPIANRLGIGELQAQIEDSAFQYAYPLEFKNTKEMIESNLPQKRKTLQTMIRKLKTKLQKEQLPFSEIYGRTKHYYSLYRKLQKNNKNLQQIYDLVAMRVIVTDIPQCYAVLGLIHQIWRPIKGRIKDYIAQPKPNGYQSLHTTVFGENQNIVEIQIRTQKMHEQAELGIASHWLYKESNKITKKDLSWVNELADWLKHLENDKHFLEGVKIDVFQNHIFVFTPRGDVIDLPEGATPIDFAYHIHSDIGNKCSQSLVNNNIVPLNHVLKNGDVVEILIDKKRKGPNAEWLKFIKTRTARHEIESHKNKNWIKFLPKFTK
ncbi:MAG: RelA/SpoT family protein [Patescibacteria group bacterium]